ncbi:MAG: PAS domain S-box protein, partial [Firmicutes bacterium]|nr:PAS domain S-box protein [Bacillota bacterium]
MAETDKQVCSIPNDENIIALLFESAAEAIVIVDGNGKILNINGTCESLFGWGREELEGKSVEVLMPLRFHEKHVQHRSGYMENPLQRVMGKGLILSAIKKDGSEFPVEISLSYTDTSTGPLVMAHVFDISERVKQEEKLKEQSQIIDQIHDGIIGFNTNKIITSWNKGAERLFEFSSEEMIGKDISTLFAEWGTAYLDQNILNTTLNESSLVVETLMMKKSGNSFPAQLNISVTHDRLDFINGFIVYVTDITRTVASEDSLRKNEAILNDFLDNVSEMIQIVGADGKIIYVNKYWREKMGYSLDEIQDLSFTKIIRQDYIDHCNDIFSRLSKGENFIGVEIIFITKDGQEIIAEGNINGRFDSDGFVSTRGIFRDITQARKANEQNRKLFSAVEQSSSIVVITDIEGVIEYVNPRFTQVTGYTFE